jgi:tRNA(fMet)-specific endonuclease VapC
MSALRYLLDTNICIYIAKQRPPSVARRFAKLAIGSVGMSLITFGELRYGAEKSSQRVQAVNTLSRLARVIPVITPGDAVAERYGVIRTYLERAGMPIGNNDLWIAAHALSLGVTLISNNTREFDRVPKLKLDNWVE